MPPVWWTPTTSSESSKPRRNLSSIAREQTAPAIAPMARAPIGLTAPQAGVIATRAEISPDAAPILVAAPFRIRSTRAQASSAADAATAVLRKTTDADCPADRADPALKPNQPTQSSPAPTRTRGRLCGFAWSTFGQPWLRPRTSDSARPAIPAVMWTARPPAKSMVPRLLAIQPPTTEAANRIGGIEAAGSSASSWPVPAYSLTSPSSPRPPIEVPKAIE